MSHLRFRLRRHRSDGPSESMSPEIRPHKEVFARVSKCRSWQMIMTAEPEFLANYSIVARKPTWSRKLSENSEIIAQAWRNVARTRASREVRGANTKPGSYLRRGGSKFSGVGELTTNWFDNQSCANCPCTRENSHRSTINQRLHPLQIRLELALGDAGGLDTNAAEVLRLSATSNAVTSCGAGSSKKANAWHKYVLSEGSGRLHTTLRKSN